MPDGSNLGEMLTGELSDQAGGLPGVTVVSYDSLRARAPAALAAQDVPASCATALQLVMHEVTHAARSDHVDVVLCGALHVLRDGGFEVGTTLVSIDPYDTYRLSFAAVGSRDEVVPYLVQLFAEWLRDPSTAERVAPGVTPIPEVPDR